MAYARIASRFTASRIARSLIAEKPRMNSFGTMFDR
jgi:hypothetical protein